MGGDNYNKHPEQEHWGSRLGVILAVAGSAVGLGNFLRFPGQAVENGGGAFMIPYFIALLLLGIPLAWCEWTMGRYAGARGWHSSPGILGAITRSRWGRYAGVLGLLVPCIILMYYALIESWCLWYAWGFVSGSFDLGDDPALHVERSREFFARVAGSTHNGAGLDFGLQSPFVFWLIVFALNVYFVGRGLHRGIEIFVQWAMPIMAICAVIVLIRVLTLGTPNPEEPELNVVNGLGYMWNPDLSKLGDFNTWLAAAGQIFFSLSLGIGVIINYASYVRRKDDVALSSLTAVATNEVFEVTFGGLITITATFVFLGTTAAAGGGFSLAFETLPVVFEHMGGFGRGLGAFWFFMLFLAAITSSMSVFQPITAFIEEALGFTRHRAVAALAVLSGIGTFWLIFFSKDTVALDTMDFWVGTVGILILATIEIIFFGWFFGAGRGVAELQRGALIKVPTFMKYVVKFVTPAYLLVVLIGFCIQNLPEKLAEVAENPVSVWTLAFVGVIGAIFVALTMIGAHRWKAAGIGVEGCEPVGETEDEGAGEETRR